MPSCHHAIPAARAQRGFTLVELLVGVIIGLLVVAVALGAMMGSRAVSGSVGDISQMQQQAAYAFRVIARQIRQGGSLSLDSGDSPENDGYYAFKLQAKSGGFDVEKALDGADNPGAGEYKLTLRSREYKVPPSGSSIQVRDCLGENASDNMLESRFFLDIDKYELKCRSGNGQTQALIQNVADFQVRYVVDEISADRRQTHSLRYANFSAIGDRKNVVGIEICLVLFGNERVDTDDAIPEENFKYTGCTPAAGGAAQELDIRTLGGIRKDRLHMPFRTVFQRRSQAVPD